MREEGIGETTKKSWVMSTNAANNIVKKLKRLRKMLIRWEKTMFGNARQKKKQSKNWISKKNKNKLTKQGSQN